MFFMVGMSGVEVMHWLLLQKAKMYILCPQVDNYLFVLFFSFSLFA